jgi:signal transduction histidine kinase
MTAEQAGPSSLDGARPPEPKPTAAGTKVIGQQARQSRHLIADLLDVVRINHGKTALRKQPVDLADVLDRAIETMRPAITERHQFAADYPRGGKLLLEGDAARLEQIVVNLLANAVTCTPRGGRLALRAMRAGGDVSLAIDDNRIFELFAQGGRNGAETRDGLGIRLAIVQKLAHLHGGYVSAASAGPGRATTFIVRLPALANAGPDQTSGTALSSIDNNSCSERLVPSA